MERRNKKGSLIRISPDQRPYLGGRGGARTPDLTDVNRDYVNNPLGIHGQFKSLVVMVPILRGCDGSGSIKFQDKKRGSQPVTCDAKTDRTLHKALVMKRAYQGF